jgi:2-polyprenyl-6-methoxyphenol hydroxylase-like FAD-dependent oxidoreductase
MIAGLLVDGLNDVPDQQDFLASEGDLFMAAFHQGGGRLRVYLCPGNDQRHRFGGPAGLEEFRRSAAFRCIPFGDRLAEAEPAGPLATYPGDESWTERPYSEGVVLIGDAAGYNNPIIGEGLSIALRDARMLRDLLRNGDGRGEPWAAGLEAYATERVERMRRLRAGADFMAAAFAADGPDRPARMMGLLGALFGGPENGPPEAFDGRLIRAVTGG